MNTRVLIFLGIIALLFFVYCYQNRIEKNKKKHKKKSHAILAIKDKQQKKVRIDENIQEYQPDSIDSELDYLSLNNMGESNNGGDVLSALDGVSSETDISKYL